MKDWDEEYQEYLKYRARKTGRETPESEKGGTVRELVGLGAEMLYVGIRFLFLAALFTFGFIEIIDTLADLTGALLDEVGGNIDVSGYKTACIALLTLPACLLGFYLFHRRRNSRIKERLRKLSDENAEDEKETIYEKEKIDGKEFTIITISLTGILALYFALNLDFTEEKKGIIFLLHIIRLIGLGGFLYLPFAGKKQKTNRRKNQKEKQESGWIKISPIRANGAMVKNLSNKNDETESATTFFARKHKILHHFFEFCRNVYQFDLFVIGSVIIFCFICCICGWDLEKKINSVLPTLFGILMILIWLRGTKEFFKKNQKNIKESDQRKLINVWIEKGFIPFMGGICIACFIYLCNDFVVKNLALWIWFDVTVVIIAHMAAMSDAFEDDQTDQETKTSELKNEETSLLGNLMNLRNRTGIFLEYVAGFILVLYMIFIIIFTCVRLISKLAN